MPEGHPVHGQEARLEESEGSHPEELGYRGECWFGTLLAPTLSKDMSTWNQRF